MLVDVIIPSKTSDQMAPILMQCISSLKSSEPTIKFNAVVVESGEHRALGQDRTIAYDQDIFCYNHALNLGINSTQNEWVILANNDLIFHPYFMSEILNAHAFHPDIQSFSPWNNMDGWHDSAMSNYPYADLYVGYDTSYRLAGWCIIVRREVLNRIDLNERCRLWYSDNIYSDELQRYGIQHALIRQSRVDHLCTQTIDFSRYDTGEDYARYMREK